MSNSSPEANYIANEASVLLSTSSSSSLSFNKPLQSHKTCRNPPFATLRRSTCACIGSPLEMNLTAAKRQPRPIRCFSNPLSSEMGSTCCNVSFKMSVMKHPTKRPKGIISSLFLEIENMISEKKLNTQRATRDHLSAFSPRRSSCFRAMSAAFFHGSSLTGTGMASRSFSFITPICRLGLLGSPNWAIDTTFVQLFRKGLRRTRKMKHFWG